MAKSLSRQVERWGAGMRSTRIVGLVAGVIALGAIAVVPPARADSVSSAVTMAYQSGASGPTQIVAWDAGEEGDHLCVTYQFDSGFGGVGDRITCAFGTVEIDEALSSATVSGTVRLDTGEDVVVESTHLGLLPTTHRRPALSSDLRPTTPQGTNHFACYTMGTYRYEVALSRDATVEGTVTRGGSPLGTPEWADLHRSQTSHDQAIRNCG